MRGKPFPAQLSPSLTSPWHVVTFTLSSIASRAIRFFLVAALLWRFGEPIRVFIENRLMLLTTAFAALLVGGFLAIKVLF